MNINQMKSIFANYIENFERLNNEVNSEYYKWQICYEFKILMDEALATETERFAEALYKVKECSRNIIDSYTQPFYGLVKYAQEEPETVRKMFQDLYVDTNGNIEQQMEQIRCFFDKCNELLEKYYPGSYLYKQNSHSVSSYLFLYDPNHHYMYKATQSQVMADCIEFYDDWGTGDNINLLIYYRMCDEILAEIKNSPELLATNKSRYDGNLRLRPGKLHNDEELHILLFDIIYCSQVYNLYEGMVFKRPKSKEKQLIIEQKNKAKILLSNYEQAKANAIQLEEATNYFVGIANEIKVVKHKTYGECEILSVNEKYLKIKSEKTGEEKQLSLAIVIANGIVSFAVEGFAEKVKEYAPIMKKVDSIPRMLESAAVALKPYEEYLD